MRINAGKKGVKKTKHNFIEKSGRFRTSVKIFLLSLASGRIFILMTFPSDYFHMEKKEKCPCEKNVSIYYICLVDIYF